MTMKKKTWHYRWYQYWLTNGKGKSPTYREDLCHYIRVILWWAPITWIDQHTSWDWEKIGAYGTMGFGAAIILVGITILSITYPTQMGMIAIIVMGIIALLAGLVSFIRWRQNKSFGIVNTASLAWKYAVAKKRKICPYLEFE